MDNFFKKKNFDSKEKNTLKSFNNLRKYREIF